MTLETVAWHASRARVRQSRVGRRIAIMSCHPVPWFSLPEPPRVTGLHSDMPR